MKLVLAMLTCNDAPMLRIILPKLLPHFDECVIGYSESTDGTREILDATDAIVAEVVAENDWGKLRNAVLAVAQARKGTHCLFLDSDELLLQEDLKMLRAEFESTGSLPLAFLYPRVELVDDFFHYDPSLAPDYQARGFPLNCGFHYSGRIHEQLCRDGQVCSQNSGWYLKSKRHIYHGGKCKPPKEVALKYIGYAAMIEGKDRPKELPEGYQVPPTWAPGTKAPFVGPNPFTQ